MNTYTDNIAPNNSIAEEFNNNETKNEAKTQEQTVEKAIALGKEALEKHDIPAAFDHLFFAANLNRDAFQLFIRIPENEHWIRLITEEQVELLKDHAQKGYFVSQFTLGRYYQVVEASYDEARDLFLAAAKAGLADASAALSIMYRLGQFGEVEIDREKYLQSLDEASEKGSGLALYQSSKATILGLEELEPRPQNFIDNLKQWPNWGSEDILKIDPVYYELMALAYQVQDDWKTAAEYYLKCIRMGRIESYPDYLMITSYNLDYQLIDEEGYYKGIETGCQNNIPYCFLMRATLNKDLYDSTDDEKERDALHQLIEKDLNTASMMGDGNATVQLGNHCYYGEYGFEEDNDLAWNHYINATGMNMAEAWSMLCQMILDGNAPDNLPNSFLSYCRLMALRLGDQSQLIPVIIAYRSGGLDKYKNEVEKYYTPQYNILPDEEKATYFGMSFIAIVNPSGKVDLVEFDLETATWDELCAIINAKQLSPIRTDTMQQIAKDAGLDDSITAWTDGKGYHILTLEDENGKPKCFDDLYQLKEVVKKLGYEIDNIYYNDFPDA